MAAKKKKAAKKRKAAQPHVVRRAEASAPLEKPKRVFKTGLKALVPSAYRPEGETNPFLQVYKTKWLSKLNFASDANVQSLLMLAVMVLAIGRESEAESIADQLIKHVDVRSVNNETRTAIASALYLSAWLKTKRHVDSARILERARDVGRTSVHKDREWLSNEAAGEIQDALERQKLAYLAYPFAGIVRWLNDVGARAKAESVLAVALDATRSLMK